MYKSKKLTNLCISVLITVFWVVFAVKTLPMVFMTNDDTAIQIALSGAQTGTPYPYHQFLNSLLGIPLAGLYHLTTAVPWWYAWSMFCMVIGIICIQWGILNNAANKIEAVFFIIVFGLGFWIYSLGNTAFTVVPCIFALGVVILLFSNDKTRWNFPLVFISSLVIVISYLHRDGTGLAMFCYFALGLLYYVGSCVNLSMKQKGICYVGVLFFVGALVFVSAQVDGLLKEQRNSDEFREYNDARIVFMDYPHVSYDENPKIYEEYGWDRNLTTLVSSWCFLDERVNAEAFTAISNAEPIGINDEIGMVEVQQTSFFLPLIELLETNKYASTLAYIALFIFIFGELYIGECGYFKTKLNFFYISNAVGSGILLLYLIANKRLPLRVYMIILIPMGVISSLLLMKIHRKSREKHHVLWYFFMGALLLLALPAFLHNYEEESIAAKVKSIENCNVVDSYLLENSENVYIADFGAYSSIYPFGKPVYNLINWGGSAYHSDYFNLHLENNGLSKLNMDTMKQDNVYVLTASAGEGQCSYAINLLFDCLVDYGATSVKKVDTINETCDVYKFYFDEKLEGYTGFYKQGKYTFYYVDGVRQTKDFKLNGNEYKCNDENLVWKKGGWINSLGYISK